FRGKESANDEVSAGGFFDRLSEMPSPTKIFVRHNRKQRMEDSDIDAASKIRGSGQFADVPDLLLEIRRKDKRTHEAWLSLTKFRHGRKPDDLQIWFDAGQMRLIAVPPVICLLQHGPMSREDLLRALDKRFGLAQSAADAMIRDLGPFLSTTMQVH